jgi:hypothetical protein
VEEIWPGEGISSVLEAEFEGSRCRRQQTSSFSPIYALLDTLARREYARACKKYAVDELRPYYPTKSHFAGCGEILSSALTDNTLEIVARPGLAVLGNWKMELRLDHFEVAAIWMA